MIYFGVKYNQFIALKKKPNIIEKLYVKSAIFSEI